MTVDDPIRRIWELEQQIAELSIAVHLLLDGVQLSYEKKAEFRALATN